MASSRPLPGIVKLALGIIGIWFWLWVLTPFWVSFSPFHQKFAALQDYYEIPYGALYYNDIPFINEAVMSIRDSIRFLPRSPVSEKTVN